MAAEKKQEASVAGKVQLAERQFDKKQIVDSARYCNQRDLVEALLEKGKKYTIATVDNLIEKYKKGKVK